MEAMLTMFPRPPLDHAGKERPNAADRAQQVHLRQSALLGHVGTLECVVYGYPALLTRMSICPNRLKTSVAMRDTSS